MSYKGFIHHKKGEQDFYELKNKAAEFYRGSSVPEELERALNVLFLQQPDDLYGYLANYFAKLSAPPRISRLNGKEIYDAGGQLSVETEVFCIVNNEETRISSATVSTNFGLETSEDWKATVKERAEHVTAALQWIANPLNKMLKGLNPCDQTQVDHILSKFLADRWQDEKDFQTERMEGSKGIGSDKLPPQEEPVLPGCWAIGTASLAVAKAGAQIHHVPLYKYIAALRSQEAQTYFHIPLPLVTLLSCGNKSPGKLNLPEEVIFIPKAGQRVKQIITMALEIQKEMMRIMNSSSKAGAGSTILSATGAPVASFDRPEQPLDLIAEACHSLGLVLGAEVHLALNCAASELMDYTKGKYEVAAGGLKSPDELVDLYQGLISKFPAIVALIDPLRREDVDQWEKLSNVIGDSCALLTFTPNLQAPPIPGVTGHILQQINETTVSALISFTAEYQGAVLMGTTCREPCSDDSLSDVAVGLGLDYVLLGGLSAGERMTKYNRLISIEEELDQQNMLASWEKHRPPLFTTREPDDSVPPDAE
ncbi:enolase 4 [Genypterus blacodes]|uniref:enolase 4 n=1 Tax=Genypterus blacodes TaxID=154954 RepID=UPI003F766FA5